MIDIVEKAHNQHKITYKLITQESVMSYSTVMRWKKRYHQKMIIIGKPGPKKTEPLNYSVLANRCHKLDHKVKKTMNTAKLYREYREQISRRDLQTCIRAWRKLKNITDHRLRWNAPGVVWSMDDTLYKNTPRIKCHHIQDLASRYKFKALMASSMTAEKVARHLKDLFDNYGPPLFLKRDNAKNFNHPLIDDLLQKYIVIPLNSPVRYPKYNGGIENAQKQIKEYCADRENYHIQDTIDLAIHKINHQPRRILSGQNACEVFFRESKNNKFNKRQRKEVYQWIENKALMILKDETKLTQNKKKTAWRIAVKLWLVKNDIIKINKNKKVLPNFFDLLAHN